jgi:DNA (cytosine-5)-methyltransferase 1
MKAYYNENDRYLAGWLRNLVAAGLIAPGDVDERSIRDVAPVDLRGYTQCHFFAGLGLWSHALRSAAWPDDRPAWTGSCPCQPFSVAGRGKGSADDRHLWPEFHRLIAGCRPPVVVGEQVASRLGREWLGAVRADLEALGYAVGAADLCSAGVGAPNIRQRLFWVADATHGGLGDAIGARLEGHADAERGDERAAGPSGVARGPRDPWRELEWIDCLDGKRRPAQPGIFPLAQRHPGDVARLRAYGNAINPVLAAEFVKAWMECEPF